MEFIPSIKESRDATSASSRIVFRNSRNTCSLYWIGTSGPLAIIHRLLYIKNACIHSIMHTIRNQCQIRLTSSQTAYYSTLHFHNSSNYPSFSSDNYLAYCWITRAPMPKSRSPARTTDDTTIIITKIHVHTADYDDVYYVVRTNTMRNVNTHMARRTRPIIYPSPISAA